MMKPRDDQGIWNFLFALLFVLLAGGAVWYLDRAGIHPHWIPLFDAVLLVLATFRLIRLISYDKILQFFRDWFLKKTVMAGEEGGAMIVVREKFPRGPRRTFSDLLDCPWCTGVWIAIVVSFAYFATPLSWFPIFILALAGAASFVQLAANAIGWNAERGKGETEKLMRELS